ncbi:MAG: EF-hand domain-containing protein [Planctomycetes bacterium]|nr:EF-hand domain-containing protein [Planctomycetota bacterium]
MRSGLYGILVCLAATAITMAQSPDGGVNNGDPGEGGRGGRGRMMGPPPNVMFQAIDIDGDGTITKVELRKAVAALKNLDTDGDGNITLAEVTPMGGPVGDPTQFVERMFENDKNGDGKLTAEELPGRMAERFLRDGDQDGDGALSGDELTAAVENMRNRRGGPGGSGGPGGAGSPRGATNFDPQQMTGRLMAYDQNNDGKLSANEVPQEAMGLLQGADQNGDGLIEPAEAQAVAERMGKQFRGNLGRGGPDRGNRGGERGPGGNPRNEAGTAPDQP